MHACPNHSPSTTRMRGTCRPVHGQGLPHPQFRTQGASPLHVIVWYLPPDSRRPPQVTQEYVMNGVLQHILQLPAGFKVLLIGDTNIQTVRNVVWNGKAITGKWCVRATAEEMTRRKQAATKLLVAKIDFFPFCPIWGLDLGVATKGD
eukprot:COSAG02_NODE_56_length_43700_cov_33.650765_4_plen_148_part_00